MKEAQGVACGLIGGDVYVLYENEGKPDVKIWEQRFIREGFGELWQQFQPKLRNAVGITLANADEEFVKIGASKIGGSPDLPDGFIWSTDKDGKPLSFLAQINLAETTRYDLDKELPQSGMLYFFYDIEEQPWGYKFEHRDSHKVIFFDGNIVDLKRTESTALAMSCATMTFESEVNLPSTQSLNFGIKLNDNERKFYRDNIIYDPYFGQDDLHHKLLGYSDNIQESMEDECQLVFHGIEGGDSDSPKAKELKKNALDWQLLFQVSSDEQAVNEMIWGDEGKLYFWIRKQDLVKKDFSKTWFILQCS